VFVCLFLCLCLIYVEHIGIAILHPRTLAVYELAPQGRVERGLATFYSLQKLYEHNLGIGEKGGHFTAFNMITGPFGGVKGKDMVMVQSMDGKLQVFEQTAEAFNRQLVDCLVPGCLLYLRRMDAFVMSNYANRVECYRYQVLVNAQTDIGSSTSGNSNGGNSKKDDSKIGFGLTPVRSAMVEWSIHVGDSVIQLVEGKFLSPGNSSGGSSGSDHRGSREDVLVLTEHSLVLLDDTGKILQMRRLEKEPSCVHPYLGAVGQGHNFLLSYRDGTVQVFSDFSLVWAFMAESMPVQM
jgi:Bardet-Biedl syndrome 9 protein